MQHAEAKPLSTWKTRVVGFYYNGSRCYELSVANEDTREHTKSRKRLFKWTRMKSMDAKPEKTRKDDLERIQMNCSHPELENCLDCPQRSECQGE